MKKYLSKTIRGSFLVITLILMLIMGIAATTLSYLIFYQNLRNNLIHSTETNLQLLANSIDSDMAIINNLASWSQTNNNVVNYLMSNSSSDNYRKTSTVALERLSEEYLNTKLSSYISRIIIMNIDTGEYMQRIPNSKFSTAKAPLPIVTQLPYFQSFIEDPGFQPGLQDDPFVNKPEKMLPIIRPIYHPYNTDVIGVSFLQISFSLFTDQIRDYTSKGNDPVYITVGNESYEVYNSTLRLVGKDYLKSQHALVTTDLQLSGCSLSQTISFDAFRHQLTDYFIILLFLLLFIAIVGIMLMKLLSHNISQPLEKLKCRINAIAHGDFSYDPTIEGDSELGEVGYNINQLSKDIKLLMRQQIENEKQKKDYEYQVLQSQINPHFLYNTLNSIKWMATAQNVPGIAEMTTSLAHLLKSIAKGTSTLVTVKDELDLLDDYFTIQRYRYGGSIKMQYEITDVNLLNTMILRFTLQPIVENAIFHGIEPKGQNGTIIIRLYSDSDQNACIEITDDGVGMEPETIKRVLAEDTSTRSSFFKQIGIGSVNKRLQYQFGSDYGLSIHSELSMYTTMKILLPSVQSKGK